MQLDRLFSMSVFEAASTLRAFRRRNPALADPELVQMLRSVRATLHSMDYDAGLALERALPNDLPDEPEQFFRACVDHLVASRTPFWTRLAPGGRDQVMRAVEPNAAQCLRAAGLTEAPPSYATRLWWDKLATQIRADRDAALLAQGREAELWSFEREQKRLVSQGIKKEPVWAAIEDNSLGYDILSYDRGRDRITNKLIEVKSTSASPPRLILTRNEWETASAYGSALEFHLWQVDTRELFVIAPDEMRRNVPDDRGTGRWLQVEVVV